MQVVRCYRLDIPGWIPASVNQLLASVQARIRLKKLDRHMVCVYARLAGIPAAIGQRRLSATFAFAKGQRRCDADNLLKSLLDACVHAGLLKDDGPAWCELGVVQCVHGEYRGTTITVEDI
jgi:Holliday junction resolvase RusA-like endonuclease